MSDYSTRNIIDYAFDADGTKFREELYGSIHDRISAHIDAKKQEIARGLVGQNEEVEDLGEQISSTHLDNSIKEFGFSKTAKAIQDLHDKDHITSLEAKKHLDYLKKHPLKPEGWNKSFALEEVEGLEEASINFDMHPKYTDKIENQLNNLGIKTKTKPNGNITATHKDKAHLEKHVATMQKYWGPEHIRRDKLNDRNVKDGVARMKARGDYPRQNEEVEGLEEAFPDASGKEVLGYDEYKARMKKLSDRQLKYAQKKHEREYGPDTGKRGPTGSITHYSVNNKGKLRKLPEEVEGLDENQNPSKHWEAGYDHATEAAENAGFSETAEHRKKNMLSQNPHKSGTKAHQDWHEGASEGHEHAISKMNEEVEE